MATVCCYYIILTFDVAESRKEDPDTFNVAHFENWRFSYLVQEDGMNGRTVLLYTLQMPQNLLRNIFLL